MFFNTPKTVASVVASFQKTIDDLLAINEKETQRYNNIEIEIQQLNAEQKNAQAEAFNAKAIADKIAKLISA
jgi:hypothetical protein